MALVLLRLAPLFSTSGTRELDLPTSDSRRPRRRQTDSM